MSRRKSGDQIIESHIRNAFVQLRESDGSREEAGKILQMPVERAKGDEWYLEGTSSYTGKPGKKSKWSAQKFMHSELWRFTVTAAAALLVIAALSYYQLLIRVDTRVYLDINPSFTLSVNRLDRVVGAESDNEDAEAILAQTDLVGENADRAVEVLLATMRENGYFEGEDNTVLVSVECGSRSRLVEKSEKFTQEISDYLAQNSDGGAVFCQTVQIDEETREFARSHSISSGKAALVLKLAQEHPEQDKEQMASFTMDELVTHLHSQNIDLRDSLDYKGEDLEQRWQREEERKEMSGQESSQTEDGSRQPEKGSGQSEQDAEQGGGQTERNAEQGSGQSEQDAEPASGQSEQNAEQGSGQSEQNAEPASGQTERNAEQGGGRSEQNAGPASGQTEQENSQSEPGSGQSGQGSSQTSLGAEPASAQAGQGIDQSEPASAQAGQGIDQPEPASSRSSRGAEQLEQKSGQDTDNTAAEP